MFFKTFIPIQLPQPQERIKRLVGWLFTRSVIPEVLLSTFHLCKLLQWKALGTFSKHMPSFFQKPKNITCSWKRGESRDTEKIPTSAKTENAQLQNYFTLKREESQRRHWWCHAGGLCQDCLLCTQVKLAMFNICLQHAQNNNKDKQPYRPDLQRATEGFLTSQYFIWTSSDSRCLSPLLYLFIRKYN